MGNATPQTPLDLQFPLSNCRIVVVGQKNGDDCLVELASLPPDARILGIVMSSCHILVTYFSPYIYCYPIYIATGVDLAEIKSEGNLFMEVFNASI